MKELKIICFGDSLTFGYCAGFQKDYVSLFRSKVKEDFPDYNIYIKNKGVNGETSREGLQRLYEDVIDEHADIVIMLFGSNDAAFSDYQHRALEEFSYNYDTIIKELKTKSIQLVLITQPPVIEDEEMPFIENEVLEKYSNIVINKSIEYNLPLVDMNKAFKKQPKEIYKTLFQWDGVHISDEGYILFSNTIYEILKPIIEKRIN